MSSRAFKASSNHFPTVVSIVNKTPAPFQPRNLPKQELVDKIESCKRKAWECVGLVEPQRHLEKKPKIQAQVVVENKENAAEKFQATMSPFINSSVKVEQQHQKSAITQPKKSLASRPNVEFKVNALKVVELRRELRNRGYDTQGLKKDLRARLLDAMLVELEAEGSLHIPSTSVSAKMPQLKSVIIAIPPDVPEEPSGSERIDGDASDREDAMQVRVSTSKSLGAKKLSIESKRPEGSHEMPLEQSQLDRTKKSSIEPKQHGKRHSEQHNSRDSISSMQVEHHSTTIDEPSVNKTEGKASSMGVQSAPPGVAMAILCSPAPYFLAKDAGQPCMSSAKKVSTESSPRVFRPISEKKVEVISSAVKDDGKASVSSHISADDTPPASDASTSNSKESGKMVKDMISKFSGQASLSSTLSSSSSSAVSKEMKKIKEARMAKIAEMREKSKTKSAAIICITPKDPPNVQPSSIVKGPVASASANKDRLAAQMREKAAAHKKPFVNSTLKLVSSSTHKAHLNMSGDVQNSAGSTVKQPTATKVTKAKPPSPMDTYEISDREGSDSDDSDSEAENDKQNKRIPTWAIRANLLQALEKQYHGQVDGKRVDPDDIFPEVQSCDLVAIFGQKKAEKYRSRNSSGNWMRDQVTAAEKLVYKREMGFSIPNEREESEI